MDYPKYIIFEDNGLEIPVAFSALMSHADVARRMNGYKVVSAGNFCILSQCAESKPGIYHCFGKSVTLEVNSRPEDGAILTKFFV